MNVRKAAMEMPVAELVHWCLAVTIRLSMSSMCWQAERLAIRQAEPLNVSSSCLLTLKHESSWVSASRGHHGPLIDD